MFSRIAPAVLAALWLTAAITQAQTCPPATPPAAVAAPAACACSAPFDNCNNLATSSDDSGAINRCLQEPTCKCAQLQAATYNLTKPIVVKSMRGATPPVVLDGARLIGRGAKTVLRAFGNGDQCSFPADANDNTGLGYAPVIEVNRSANVALHGFTIDVSDLRQTCATGMRKGGFAIRYVTAVSGARVTNVNIVGEPFVPASTYKTGGALTGGIQVFGANSVVQGNLIKDVGFIQVGGSSGVSAIQLINSANSTIASNQIVRVAFGIEVVNGISDSNAGDGSGTKVIGNTICGAAGIASCPLCSGGRAIKLQACRVGDDRNETTSPIPPPLRDLQVSNNYAAQFGGGRKDSDGKLAPGGSGLDLICGIQFGRFTGNVIDGRNFAAEFGLQLRSACEADSCAAPLTLHYEPKSTTHHNTFQSNTFYSGSGGTGCGGSCADVNINAEAPDQINVGRNLGSGTGANTFRGSPRQDGGFNGCQGSLFSQTTFTPTSGIATTKLQFATRGVRPGSQVTIHFVKDGVDKPFTFSNVACATMIGKKIRRLGLAPGTYTVTADYQDGNAGSRDPNNPSSTMTTNPVTILGDRLGTLTVSPSTPVPAPVGSLVVSPTSLSFPGAQGGLNPAPQTISIQSSGSTLDWAAYEGVSWLSITPTAGITPGSATVTANLAGLTAGTYTTQILVSSSDASDLTIPVTLTVGPPGTGTSNLTVSPVSLSFQATAGGANPPARSLSIGSTGSALGWSVSDNATWLVLNPISGSTPGSTGAAVNIAGLTAGTYSAAITVSAAGAGNSPVTVPVTLTIAPGTTPTLTVSPSSLSFSGTAPAPAALSLGSTGSALGFSVSDNVSWLSESPISGSTPSSVSVFVNTAGLPPGTYSGTITVSAPGALNPQVFVPVSLTIPQAGCSLSTSPASFAFTAPQGGPNAQGQLLTIGSPGAATPFTVSSNAAFLSASPTSGTTVGAVTVFTNVGTMPAGTYNGALLISCPSGGSVTVPVSLTVTSAPPPSAPFVNGFSPPSGSAGSQVSVSGGNFVGVTSVTIAGQPAGFSVSTSNSLIATVPGGTPGCGRIQVSNSAGTGQSPDVFAITPGAGPVICSFNPLSGRAGESITLRGGNFVNVQSVTINGVPASFFTGGSAFLGVTVPAGATSGLIQVVTASGSALSPTSFTVVP